jgi:hypothetical protein
MTLRDPATACRECGCTEERACVRVDWEGLPETCSWAEPDLCTACAPGGVAVGWLHPADQPSFTQEEIINEVLGENR